MSEQMYQFLGRVRTFALGTWLYHSSDLSPYILAARGFQFHNTNTIECHICHYQVSFEGIKVGQENHHHQLKIINQLKEHNKDCIYSAANTSDEDLYTLKREQLYSNMDNIYSKIKDSYTFYKGKFPRISEEVWNKYILKYQVLFSKNNPKFQQGKEIDLVKLLSIFGWELLKQQIPKLSCSFCGRTVNIQSYSTTDSQKYKIINQIKKEQNRMFEPIHQHRYFCIWGHYDDFKQNPNIYGWQICLKHLLDKILNVEKGWAEREKFQEVTQLKQQFSKIIEQFSQKTKHSISKFNELIQNAAPSVDANGTEKQVYQQKMQQTKQAIQNIVQQVDQIVKPLAKKVKYS